MKDNKIKQPTFHGLGIDPSILRHLTDLKYTIPTPIQQKAIPSGVEGEDIIGIAQTGTGKTLAFAIPVMQQISIKKGRGLVLLPTRELALQVEETFAKLGGKFGLRTVVLIGGASMHMQRQRIKNRPHVIVATPGRLIDHLEQKTISLNDVKILVLDEADRMLDMGFEPQIKKILATVPSDRQTMLFSATMPEKISQLAKNYMKQPLRVEVAPSGTAAEQIEQEVFFVRKDDKLKLLQQILTEYKGTVLLFSRTKYGAKKINIALKRMGHHSAEIHSDRSLSQRREALDGFKNGKYRILIATDIAARGIDVVGIELVINYDLPDQAEDYVHRIGRTGRAGTKGKAIAFAMPEQKRDVKLIESLIRVRLPVRSYSQLPEIKESFVDREPLQRGNRRSQKDHKDKNNRYQNQSKAGPRNSGQASRNSRNRRPSRSNSRSKMR
ncbi:DEAD/DEAH box helicase [Patescibacteria group bacterium]|nr:DEAD/DEAH box helicase [Patescibacteria group bacterium]MBU4452953.1 DEAD/DEAH box helicase [Patescibacteria group bacterium]MCG2687385.1 DEAD/DEAH box helicase [Candidatus Parcubacteria bacterium]